MSSTVCPSCGGGSARIGRIISERNFAGAPVNLPDSELFRCQACGLGYRFPAPDAATLQQLYGRAPETYWKYDLSERPDWRFALECIQRSPPSPRILDYGCYDGAFLQNLSRTENRFGVELSTAASAKAREKGITVAMSMDAFPAETQFDAITAFDVLEHVHDPLALLRQMLSRLRVGGSLIVASGDLDTRAWRFMGSKYWYCSIPEHIAFISERWCRNAGMQLGLEIVEMRRFSRYRGRHPYLRSFYETSANCLYKVSPTISDWARHSVLRVCRGSSYVPALGPPTWSTARDHLAVVFKRLGV